MTGKMRARKVFLPITNLCRDRCSYCTFRRDPDDPGAWTMSRDEIAGTLARARRQGCKEALMCLGDRPEAAFASHRATLASVGISAVYNGRIDLAAAGSASLFIPAYSLAAPPGGTNGATQSFGTFPGSIPGPAVASFIGIQHIFSLTPGDTATFNSTFHLVAVPEPATFGLVLLGLVGLALAGRRRSA
jgi:hypothetical protein